MEALSTAKDDRWACIILRVEGVTCSTLTRSLSKMVIKLILVYFCLLPCFIVPDCQLHCRLVIFRKPDSFSALTKKLFDLHETAVLIYRAIYPQDWPFDDFFQD